MPPTCRISDSAEATRDRSGAALEYGEDVYRGDRFRFVTENSAPEGYRFITSAPGVVSV